MSESDHAKFDPQGQVTFDLPFGHVHLDGAPARVVVPADALAALCQAAGTEPELVRLVRDTGRARFAVLSPAAADRARAELAAGHDWTRLLASFNAQGAQA